MSTFRQRLGKLEKTLAPHVENDLGWGTMARYRNLILSQSKQRGESSYADAEKQLDAMGPRGLWNEAVRALLREHGFVEDGVESLAELVCRTLGIGISELRVRIEEGRLGTMLLNRFGVAN